MRVGVFGLWHLGCVTAACLARAGHEVAAVDPDADLVARLARAQLPLFEPGLQDLVAEGLAGGRLRFDSNPAAALYDAEILWVTFDTPVDDDDVAQPSAVVDQIIGVTSRLPHGCLVVISSQLPVGTTRRIAERADANGRPDLTFGYSPENLRLGKAIEVFTRPDRVVVGLQADADRAKVQALLAPFTGNIVWMGLESAEMTKHAINAFLATSVVFMNEISTICERAGADAKDVERGLKSEERIGAKAYLSPGAAYAGGTLARDVTTLADLGRDIGIALRLVPAVRDSNAHHRGWVLDKLKERLGTIAGRRIALLGLTYKPGTSTLRRSSAVELALALAAEGATVIAFDPAVRELPPGLAGRFSLAATAEEALGRADAVVLATPWPEFRDIDWSRLTSSTGRAIVVDPNWFLAAQLRSRADVAYAAVGLPWSGG